MTGVRRLDETDAPTKDTYNTDSDPDNDVVGPDSAERERRGEESSGFGMSESKRGCFLKIFLFNWSVVLSQDIYTIDFSKFYNSCIYQIYLGQMFEIS